MINNSLTNFGVLTRELPPDVFAKIKDECLNINTFNHTKINTGFLREGSPDHFLLNQNKDIIKNFALDVAKRYVEKYEKAISIKIKMDGMSEFPGLEAKEPWINVQRKYEYIPNHDHAGFLSYSLWVRIPEDSKFEFTYNTITGEIFREQINITKHFEGTLLMFPSKLIHCVYPFYNSNDSRISISGNLSLK